MASKESSFTSNPLIYSLAWISVFISQALILHYQNGLGTYHAMADSLVFNFNFALLGLGIWYIARYNDLSKTRILVFILNHFFSMIFLVIIWLFISNLILKMLISDINDIDDINYLKFLGSSFAWRFVSGLMYYTLIALIYYVYMYYANFQKKIKTESELKALVKEAELASLKNQINPHFLFNSLNSISSLTITNPEKAREMLVKLSELMRYSLKTNHNDKSPLKVELENIEKYIALEKIRFGKKLEFMTKKLMKIALHMSLPNMILQPLFENAIKHGIYESTESVTIKVTCRAINNIIADMLLKTTSIPTGKPRKVKELALKILKKDLQSFIKCPNLLTTEKTLNIFIAKLLIPQK